MELGAKNGTRTRDPDLGKVVLYQLSYFRIMFVMQTRASLVAALVFSFALQR